MASVVNSVFLKKPSDIIYTDESSAIHHPEYVPVKNLIKSLQEQGPLVAEGYVGPEAYTEPPFKLKNKIGDEEIYGWKSTYKKHRHGLFLKDFIIIGAERIQSDDPDGWSGFNGRIFYILADDITKDRRSSIRGYKPQDTDTKIYVISYNHFFHEAMTNIYPLCPFGKWLFSTPLDKMADDEKMATACKEIGQKIFDHYASRWELYSKGCSANGKRALKRICNAAKGLTEDGAKRKEQIARAWKGVGDRTWCWMG
jgi:hypothetical protein